MSDEQNDIDITPDTHFLESIRADRGSYWTLFAEAVDNSFDATAQEVRLGVRHDLLSIRDNGVGITKDRETAIVRFGEHRAMPSTMLGRFGIGLKYHAVSAGTVMEVNSSSQDGRMTLRVDWDEVIRSGRWNIRRPKWIPSVRQIETGTNLVIRGIRWVPPAHKDIAVTTEKLAQLFYPALAEGRRIFINDEAVPVLSEPRMRDIIEGDVRLSNGKAAHVRAGLIVDPKSSSLWQVQVSYRHRVIMPMSIFACNSYGGLRRMFARVILTGPWVLSRFKDKMADNDATELEDQVLEMLRPLLEQCQSAQMSMRIKEMTELLNEKLPEDLRPARPEKKKEPKNTPGQRRRSPHGKTDDPENPSGPARKKSPARGIEIKFDNIAESAGFGKFEHGRPSRIVLALDNPHIAALLEHRDQVMAAQSLYNHAAMIFCAEGYQPDLFDGAMSFGMRAWLMAKGQKTDTSTASVDVA